MLSKAGTQVSLAQQTIKKFSTLHRQRLLVETHELAELLLDRGPALRLLMASSNSQTEEVRLSPHDGLFDIDVKIQQDVQVPFTLTSSVEVFSQHMHRLHVRRTD
jgi:hypothetical protein